MQLAETTETASSTNPSKWIHVATQILVQSENCRVVLKFARLNFQGKS